MFWPCSKGRKLSREGGVSFSRAERSLRSTFDAGWNRDTEELTSHLDRAANYLSNRRAVRIEQKSREEKKEKNRKRVSIDYRQCFRNLIGIVNYKLLELLLLETNFCSRSEILMVLEVSIIVESIIGVLSL